jgi:hypothetical protein
VYAPTAIAQRDDIHPGFNGDVLMANFADRHPGKAIGGPGCAPIR